MIYLDHNATAPLEPCAAEAMQRWMTLDRPANPSSPHAAGRKAREALSRARDQLAAATGLEARGWTFTSGGTEANNLALRGAWWRNGNTPFRRRLITTTIEHPSVRRAAEALRAEGCRVDEVGVGASGQVDLDALERALDDDVFLVSVMAVNNETGCAQDLEAIAALCAQVGAPLHTDACQAPARLGPRIPGEPDLVTLSSHKVGGPHGVGALWARDPALLAPVLHGGVQQRGLRPGTEPVMLAVGMGAAYTRLAAETDEDLERVRGLDAHLIHALTRAVPEAKTRGEWPSRVPGVLSLTIPEADAELLVVALDLAGFCVSTGAACSSGAREPSPVLLAMGLSEAEARSTLRISLGRHNTLDDVDGFVEALAKALPGARAATDALGNAP